MRYRFCCHLLPFVHLGPKEARVGRVTSGGWVVAAGKAVFGCWWGKVGVGANIKLRVWAIACMAGTSPLRDVGKA